MSIRYRCECGWEGNDGEMETVQVFAGNAEEPAEHETKCPCCDRPFDEFEEVPLCATCGDIYVQEEDDVCHVCHEKELADAMRFDDAPGG